jgi:hypothetical protein
VTYRAGAHRFVKILLDCLDGNTLNRRPWQTLLGLSRSKLPARGARTKPAWMPASPAPQGRATCGGKGQAGTASEHGCEPRGDDGRQHGSAAARAVVVCGGLPPRRTATVPQLLPPCATPDCKYTTPMCAFGTMALRAVPVAAPWGAEPPHDGMPRASLGCRRGELRNGPRSRRRRCLTNSRQLR